MLISEPQSVFAREVKELEVKSSLGCEHLIPERERKLIAVCGRGSLASAGTSRHDKSSTRNLQLSIERKVQHLRDCNENDENDLKVFAFIASLNRFFLLLIKVLLSGDHSRTV